MRFGGLDRVLPHYISVSVCNQFKYSVITSSSVNSRPRSTHVNAKRTRKSATIFKREGNEKSLHIFGRSVFVPNTKYVIVRQPETQTCPHTRTQNKCKKGFDLPTKGPAMSSNCTVQYLQCGVLALSNV